MTMKTNSKIQAGVKVAVGIKCGGLSVNHARRALSLKIKTGIKAGEGIVSLNHNRRLG